MNNIYVTGHKNPDMDSIVAAISYANLRNALGSREYKAVRIGSINDETHHMLERFGFEAPELIKNMRTQISDIDFDHPPELDRSVTMDLAWRTMREEKIFSLPILNDDGRLYGMLSAGDIATFDMQTVYSNRIDDLPVFNLLSVLEGQYVNEFFNPVNTVSGNVCIALPQAYDEYSLFDKDNILICGDQPEVVDKALEAGVNCVILCQSEVPQRWAESGASTCLISTPLDPRRAARLIFQAIPAMRVCVTEDIICFHLDDYIDDVREQMLKSRHRSYPVLDREEHVVGTLSRFHVLRPRRKRVVLVDHNEAAQSVSGLEQAEIMEIIDHHRLADIQTKQPIRMRNEPVGSTTTIIASMYQENGVVPTPQMAGLMAAAILSDTVMFKSPTCTKRDRAMAERLARIARLSLDELGKELFSATGADDKSAEELLRSDFKQFHIAEQNIGVSQITCVDSSHLMQRRDELLQAMAKIQKELELDIIILMLTDVLLDGSHIFYLGSDDVIQMAFSVEPKDKHFFLKGAMSRKKQIIPMLTSLWG